ncbi:hypothetical protein ACFOWA_06665 [Pedobacter lithocola]|uniref:Uncharacterized protein n=1 Tax=Pedobacter lithocola TaxID=1908239 RepID=A0ABV8P9F6_9SPHI
MSETLNIKNNGSIVYICISELPLNEQEPFKNWLLKEGQTQPVIEEEPIKFDCAYPWDYELWKSNPNATHLL